MYLSVRLCVCMFAGRDRAAVRLTGEIVWLVVFAFYSCCAVIGVAAVLCWIYLALIINFVYTQEEGVRAQRMQFFLEGGCSCDTSLVNIMLDS